MPVAQLKALPAAFLRAIMKYMSASVEKIKIPSEIRVLIAAAFIIAIGFGIITPVLPQNAVSLGVGDLGVSAVVSIFRLVPLMLGHRSGLSTAGFVGHAVNVVGITTVWRGS